MVFDVKEVGRQFGQDIPPHLKQMVEQLILELNQFPEVMRYKQLEKAIESSTYLKELEETIKEKQKNAAHMMVYEKVQAKKELDKEIDQLTFEFQHNITVEQYQSAQAEVNELIQTIMQHLQTQLVDSLNKD